MEENSAEIAKIFTDDRCYRCGVCCGASDGHPCEHLRLGADGKYYCDTYETRLGYHRTTDGMPFRCVMIRDIIEMTGGYDCCAYTQALKKRKDWRQYLE